MWDKDSIKTQTVYIISKWKLAETGSFSDIDIGK